MIGTLTPEVAQRERARLLGTLHFHRSEARNAKRALDRLEETCNRLGIRLVREPIRPHPRGETNAIRADSDPR